MNNLGDSVQLKRGVTLKNRAIMAPMTNMMSFFDGTITDNELAYYALRSGELGAVITAAANVQAIGKGWEGELGVHDDQHIPGLAKLASSIKKSGTKAILQIFHGGRMSPSSALRGEQPVSASAVKAERPEAIEPRSLSDEEVVQVIEDFKAAAIRAIRAGFDGIEIHGANTYLIQQFFSPHSNRRDDKWGGSLENRFHFVDRLVDEIIETVDNETTEPFIVGYRFSPEEYENPGIRIEDTLYLVDHLADKKLDYLHISLGDFRQFSKFDEAREKTILQQMHDKIAGRVPLISVGDIRNSADAKEALEHSEFVALGRVLLSDPHWASKALSGRDEQIRLNVTEEEREELKLNSGVWMFMKAMMSDRIK
ncbi:NADH-dependent flavin oxidoreductase [Marinilactibacillus sp. XAAS-LB27]|uniref:NADH-dependent flavin oxidoreductase n=1 Tax=Marinilactibacillus sp. XAAS-LB27 TaxID=3114538 RepID=UPI002E1969D0|nr:NADH-dependent flavin oxidoreductase [Marinilactibacillus sp. XAAS-LB27]